MNRTGHRHHRHGGDEAAPRREREHERAPGKQTRSSMLQRKTNGAGVADGAAEQVERAASSSGAPLPEGLQRKFEASLGTDLSGVRVHTGAESADAAQSVSAKAYTLGGDIHFAAGHYNPSSGAGEELLAHEVAHTVQQSGGAARKAQFKLDVSSPGDAHELEADAAASAMVAGRPAAVSGAAASVSRRIDHSGAQRLGRLIANLPQAELMQLLEQLNRSPAAGRNTVAVQLAQFHGAIPTSDVQGLRERATRRLHELQPAAGPVAHAGAPASNLAGPVDGATAHIPSHPGSELALQIVSTHDRDEAMRLHVDIVRANLEGDSAVVVHRDLRYRVPTAQLDALAERALGRAGQIRLEQLIGEARDPNVHRALAIAIQRAMQHGGHTHMAEVNVRPVGSVDAASHHIPNEEIVVLRSDLTSLYQQVDLASGGALQSPEYRNLLQYEQAQERQAAQPRDAHQNRALAELFRFGLEMIPILGPLVMFAEAASGRTITGEELTPAARAVLVAGGAIGLVVPIWGRLGGEAMDVAAQVAVEGAEDATITGARGGEEALLAQRMVEHYNVEEEVADRAARVLVERGPEIASSPWVQGYRAFEGEHQAMEVLESMETVQRVSEASEADEHEHADTRESR